MEQERRESEAAMEAERTAAAAALRKGTETAEENSISEVQKSNLKAAGGILLQRTGLRPNLGYELQNPRRRDSV